MHKRFTRNQHMLIIEYLEDAAILANNMDTDSKEFDEAVERLALDFEEDWSQLNGS